MWKLSHSQMSKTSVVQHYDLIKTSSIFTWNPGGIERMWEEGPVTNLLVCQPPPKDPESFCIWSIFAQYLFRIYLNLPEILKEVFSFYLFSGIIVLWKLFKGAPIIIQSPTRLCEFTQKVQIKQQDLHLKVWRYFSKVFFKGFYFLFILCTKVSHHTFNKYFFKISFLELFQNNSM